MKDLVNITDREGNQVFVGDKFEARMTPSQLTPDVVTVVKDITPENLECDRDFDVEDSEGNRLWNAYMVIKNNNRIL